MLYKDRLPAKAKKMPWVERFAHAQRPQASINCVNKSACFCLLDTCFIVCLLQLSDAVVVTSPQRVLATCRRIRVDLDGLMRLFRSPLC